ncbi:MAG: glycosyltransferase [Candidatus Aramenus sulfurataquae]|uniref:Glycosyltransferase n=2 Tax=Candidatus Aramenus sulfurataquae TaxID=1326980 RepID=A0A0F2LNX0_9CREN|nr:glycosyltransferase [Candidatus Aramenus sulfurataquae]
MEFTLFHHSFEVLGGSERVAVAVLYTLKELGYKVTLVTTNFNGEKVRKWDRHYVEPDKVIIRSFPLKFGIYKALYLSTMTKKENSFSTIGDVTWSTFSYVHFPWSLTDNLKLVEKYYYYEDYIRDRKKRLYFLPYKYLHRALFRRSKSRLLANSNWTRRLLEVSGYSAETLYPPVKLRRVEARERNSRLVVYVGRISPEKDLENVIEVAKRMRDFKFAVLGSTGRDLKYVDQFKSIANSLGNVIVEENPDDAKIDEYFSRAKVYFHPKVNEHFGISIVEAMSAGLIPVVHKSGGAWYDVVAEGKYGLGYESVEEAVTAIREASKWEVDMRERAEEFSFEKFTKRLSSILERTS